MDVDVMRIVIGKLSSDELNELNSLVQSELDDRKATLASDEIASDTDLSDNSATAS